MGVYVFIYWLADAVWAVEVLVTVLVLWLIACLVASYVESRRQRN